MLIFGCALSGSKYVMWLCKLSCGAGNAAARAA